MKLLAVDTCFGACSVVVLDGKRVLAHRFETMERGHAEALAPMVDDAMRAAAIAYGALERLAVTTGPGTFTGQRVGLAFMRGLRIALKKPLVGVTSLETMAWQASAESGIAHVAALHDARRDEVYLAIVDAARMQLSPMVESFGDAMRRLAMLPRPVVVCGTAAARAKEALKDVELSGVRQPDALWAARIALTRPVPDAPPRPLYLRAPDAKLPARKTVIRLFDPVRENAVALADLHRLCFDDPWDGEAIARLAGGSGFALVHGRPPSGFVLVRAAADEAEVVTLAVHPEKRRTGIANALVRDAATRVFAQGARAFFLEVDSRNAAALALYGSLGFTKVGERKGYYRTPNGQLRDALVLKRDLPLSPSAD